MLGYDAYELWKREVFRRLDLKNHAFDPISGKFYELKEKPVDIANEIARAKEDLKKAQERLTRLQADLENKGKLKKEERGFFLCQNDKENRLVYKVNDADCLVLGVVEGFDTSEILPATAQSNVKNGIFSVDVEMLSKYKVIKALSREKVKRVIGSAIDSLND